MLGNDPYYSRHEVSNSDLSELEKYFMSEEQARDVAAAYRFGNLIDAMITEPDRCDHLTYRIFFHQPVLNFKETEVPYDQELIVEQFTKEEWQTAYRMLQSFRADPYCAQVLANGEGQKVFTAPLLIDYDGFQFTLNMRCKFDLWMNQFGYGIDIKSTTATSHKQFLASIDYFNYDRQRAIYMDVASSHQDMLIGISKKNFQVFKVPIRRGDQLYQAGKKKYQLAAFRYWSLDFPNSISFLPSPEGEGARRAGEDSNDTSNDFSRTTGGMMPGANTSNILIHQQ